MKKTLDPKIIEILRNDPKSPYINIKEVFKTMSIVNQFPKDLLRQLILAYGGADILFGSAMYYRFVELYNNFDVDMIKEMLKYEFSSMINMNIDFDENGNNGILSVSGLFRNLRRYVVDGRKNLVEEIIIEFYPKFIESIKCTSERQGSTTTPEKLFTTMYILFIDSEPSENLKLFLKLQ